MGEKQSKRRKKLTDAMKAVKEYTTDSASKLERTRPAADIDQVIVEEESI